MLFFMAHQAKWIFFCLMHIFWFSPSFLKVHIFGLHSVPSSRTCTPSRGVQKVVSCGRYWPEQFQHCCFLGGLSWFFHQVNLVHFAHLWHYHRPSKSTKCLGKEPSPISTHTMPRWRHRTVFDGCNGPTILSHLFKLLVESLAA